MKQKRALLIRLISTLILVSVFLSFFSNQTAMANNFSRDSTYDVASYNSSDTFLNNSSLAWNTFLGGNEGDQAKDIAVDKYGNVYVVGTSVATWESPIRAFTVGDYVQDVFVAKVASNGILQWNTFLGGDSYDTGKGIEVDHAGNIYVSGTSQDTWGAPVRSYSDRSDTFIAKLDNNGNLVWNTFLGGNGDDYNEAISLDRNGDIYAIGRTAHDFGSWGVPLRAYQSNDAFIVKLDPNGNLQWNTFLGGVGDDWGRNLSTDLQGNIFATGQSKSSWGTPVRAYTYNTDAFVAKLNSNGHLQWNTFLGGDSLDGGNALVADQSGAVFVGGWSGSSWGVPLRPHSDTQDGFVSKLESNGELAWNTFLGGIKADTVNSITLDISGRLYVAGDSALGWGNPLQPHTPQTNWDAFIASIDISGSLQWHTFLGSNKDDLGSAIFLDDSGNLYLGGYSESTWGNPIRPYTIDDGSYASYGDAFVAKLGNASPSLPKPPVILVHGWQGLNLNGGFECNDGIQQYNGNNSTLVPLSSEYSHLAEWLEDDGYQVWIAHLESNPLSTSPLEANAKCLREQIKTVWNMNSQEITIIAHSMGGLVSRAAIRSLPANVKVKSLHTLGSPHAGIPLNTIGRFFGIDINSYCILQPAVCQMSPAYTTYYNAVHPNQSSVNYYFFGGNAGIGFLSNMLEDFYQGPNDGLVGQYSAVGWIYPDQVSLPVDWSFNAEEYFTYETHPAQSNPDLAYYVAPAGKYSQSYCKIRELEGKGIDPDKCPYIQDQAVQSIPNQSIQAASESASTNFTETQTGQLNTGQSVTLSFEIDGDGETVFYLNWNGGAAPTFTLLRPDAVEISEQYAQSNPTVVAYESSAGTPASAPYQAFVFPAGQTGSWQVNVTASSDPIDYQVFAMIESDRTLTAETDKDVYQIGENVLITAALDRGGIGLTGANVSATVTSPDGLETSVTLNDNSDGTYTGSYPIPDAPGYLSIDVNASGSDSGTPYTRNTHLITAIAPNDLQLTGNYSDQPRDDNADGLYEFLDFTAEVDLTSPGEYAISAELYAGDQLITQSGDFFQLGTGAQTVTLSFDGGTIREAGFNGPYTVKNLYLTPIDIGVTAASVESAWTTSAYSVTQFGLHPCYVLTLGHTGSGSDPIALPANSTGCSSGEYVPGETISLTASPDPGWSVSGWTGTDNDASTQTANSLTMPASDHNVSITYFKPVVPGIPVLLSPATGEMVSTLQPKLDWKDSAPPAYYYQLQVSTNNTFPDDSALVLNISASEYTFSSDLNPGTRYFWRVRGYSAGSQPSGWSTIWNFRTPLAAPNLAVPANGESLDNDRPAFDWENVDGATQYNIQVSPSPSFGTLLVSATVNASEYQMLKDLPQNKVLYWRVRAKNALVTGPWSAVWSFKTGDPPSIPVLQSPANNSTIIGYIPTLKWKAVTVPSTTTFSHYRIQLAADPDFTALIADEELTSLQFTPVAELLPGVTYYWRVRAFNTDGEYSAWSARWSFKTRANVFDNGVWWIKKLPPSSPDDAKQYPMDVYVNGVYWGKTHRLDFGHRKSAGNYPATAVIYNTGYVRLTPLGLPFGTSFILGPAHWDGGNNYFHNLQISRIDINTSSATPSGPLKITVTARDYNENLWPQYHFDVKHQITFPTPNGVKAAMNVTQTSTAVTDFAVSVSRQAGHEGFKLAQFSSMYIDEHYRDSDGVQYTGLGQDEDLAWFKDMTCNSLIFNSPFPLSGRNPWIQSFHGDDAGWQGNTPNTIIRLADPNLAAQFVPQGYWACSADENDDNLGLWLNDEAAPVSFSSGQVHSGGYSLISQDAPLPSAPGLVAPDNGVTVPTTRPTFEWEDVAWESSYNLQISTTGNFSTLTRNVTVTSSPYTILTDLPRKTKFYWRVRSIGAGGTSDWSDVWSFTTGNPPSVPTLVAPANNALVTTYPPLLDWGNSTLPAGTTFLRYEIEVDDDPNFGSPLTATRDTLTDSQYTPDPALDPNTRYHWRVRAVNLVAGVEHFSAWSAVRSFRTVIPAPTLLAPAHLSTVGTLLPVFDWEDATGPGLITGYTIQISLSPSFGTFLVNSATVSSTYTPLKNLPASKVIYWRVRVNGANGPSPWSTSQFSTP